MHEREPIEVILGDISYVAPQTISHDFRTPEIFFMLFSYM